MRHSKKIKAGSLADFALIGNGGSRELQNLHSFLLTMIASDRVFTRLALGLAGTQTPVVYSLSRWAFSGIAS